MLIVVLICIIATIYAVTPKSLRGNDHMERMMKHHMMKIMGTRDVRLQQSDLNSRRLQTTSYNTPTAYLAYSFYPNYFQTTNASCSGAPFYSEINAIGLCYTAYNGSNVPSGQSLTSAVVSGTAPGTYKLTFTIYQSSSTCSGTGTLYPSTGSFPLTVGACAAPDPDYLEYGVYRYTKAFSNQLAAVIMTSSFPASNAQGVTLNFYRKLSDCQAGGPVTNQVNMATGLCIPNPSQSAAANSGTTQFYTILQCSASTLQVSYFLDNNCILPYSVTTAPITGQCNQAYDFTGQSIDGKTTNQFSIQTLSCTNPSPITTTETISIDPKEIHAIIAFNVLIFIFILLSCMIAAYRFYRPLGSLSKSENQVQLSKTLNPVNHRIT